MPAVFVSDQGRLTFMDSPNCGYKQMRKEALFWSALREPRPPRR